MRKKLIDFYLDWVNNFLSIAKMAEYYGLSDKDTETLINIGKHYHEKGLTELK